VVRSSGGCIPVLPVLGLRWGRADWLFGLGPPNRELRSSAHHVACSGWPGRPVMREEDAYHGCRGGGRGPGGGDGKFVGNQVPLRWGGGDGKFVGNQVPLF
jgi:hypothetical protein